MSHPAKPAVLEFFAGGGLARLGLSRHFDIVWANDWDAGKCQAYRANFGSDELVAADIASFQGADLPPNPALAWASFPCQDLSLAGDRSGLAGQRSGTFYHFTARIHELVQRGDRPGVLVIENVMGLLSSRGGQDYAAVLRALRDLGYRAGCLEMDAAWFLPQSRPRLFIVAVAQDRKISPELLVSPARPCVFITPAVLKAVSRLPQELLSTNIDWFLPKPPPPSQTLIKLLDEATPKWWGNERTARLISQLSPKHLAAVQAAQATGQRQIGTVYRRTRTEKGKKCQRAEVRFDNKVGCLRTPAGGSSRQFLLEIEGPSIQARALSSREAISLMGVEPSYKLPQGALAGLRIAGDGVAVPVVEWLSEHLLSRLV
jgi:DNA (cytosine-5)-methyltransferase 1